MSEQGQTPLVEVFIDWCNLGDLRHFIDYPRLWSFLNTLGSVRRAHMFIVDHHARAGRSSPRSSAFSLMLQQTGFTLHHKIAKREAGNKLVDSNIDVEMTMTVMDVLYQNGHALDKILLITGDRDFWPLIRRIQHHREERPIQVVVMGCRDHTSHRLARTADQAMFVDDFLSEICSPRDFASLVISGQARA